MTDPKFRPGSDEPERTGGAGFVRGHFARIQHLAEVHQPGILAMPDSCLGKITTKGRRINLTMLRRLDAVACALHMGMLCPACALQATEQIYHMP